MTIIDTVELEGLEVGTKYQLSGWQMLKEENAELLIDGKRVENSYIFTADAESMEIQIEFTLNTSALHGQSLVTFEELYDMSNPDEPEKVAEHKDISDEGQTVTVETLEEPEQPETPANPSTPTQSSDAPKTGDNTNILLFVFLLIASGGGLAGLYLWKYFRARRS